MNIFKDLVIYNVIQFIYFNYYSLCFFINKLYYIRSSSDWPRACCSSSCANIIWFNSSSRTSSKYSSIWPESGLKRRSPGSKKHMLIRSIDVRIRTRRDHFWTSSVLVEQLQVKIHVQKFEEMEWSAGPIGSRANSFISYF